MAVPWRAGRGSPPDQTICPDPARPIAPRAMPQTLVPRWAAIGLFLLAIILPLAILTVVAAERRAALWRDAIRDTEAGVAALYQQAKTVFETQDLLIELVEDMIHGQTDPQIAQAATSARLAALVARLEQTVSMWIADERGEILAASLPWPPGLNIAGQDYFVAQFAAPSDRFIGQPYLGRTTHMASFSMSRRRTAPDGSFAGTIHVAVNPRFFEEAFRVALGPARGTAALIRADGLILARFPPVPLGYRLPPDSPLVQAIARNPAGGMADGVSTVDGTPRLYGYRSLSPFPLQIGFGVDLPARIEAWWAAVLGDALVALLVAAALSVAVRIALRGARARAEAAAARAAAVEDRHAAERLSQEQRGLETLGRMARGVAHDVNNLLTVIIGNLETLGETARDPRSRAAVEGATRAAEAGAQLAASLLSYARIQVLTIEPVALPALVAGMQPVLRDLARPGVRLILDLPPDLPPCLGDPAQLQAALGNLVRNARDAMPAGGEIRVTARVATLAEADLAGGADAQPGGFIALAVTDTGTGMAPDVAARACEPFFTTKAGAGGSGLGLSQVSGLVRQLGGEVRLDSAVGRGTTVTLFLPRAEGTAAPAAPEAPAPAEAPAAPPRPLRVLVVDDQEQIRTLAAMILSRAGYDPCGAGSGSDALALIERGERFDLLLSDVVMPGSLDGVALVRYAQSADPDMAVALMSGFAPDADAIHAADVVFLRKPFNRQALLDAASRALEQARARRPAHAPLAAGRG